MNAIEKREAWWVFGGQKGRWAFSKHTDMQVIRQLLYEIPNPTIFCADRPSDFVVCGCINELV